MLSTPLRTRGECVAVLLRRLWRLRLGVTLTGVKRVCVCVCV